MIKTSDLKDLAGRASDFTWDCEVIPLSVVLSLLARTEAGADGAVAWTDDRGLERLREGKQELVSAVRLRSYTVALYTHPQDASGDAEWTKYEELIYAVGNKYPGETRHETALRYIRQAESHVGSEGCAAMQAKEAK